MNVISKFIAGNYAKLILLSIFVASITMLYQLGKDNILLRSEIDHWKVANQTLSQHIESINKTLVIREDDIKALNSKTRNMISKVKVVKDENNCIDSGIPDDLLMLISTNPVMPTSAGHTNQ